MQHEYSTDDVAETKRHACSPLFNDVRGVAVNPHDWSDPRCSIGYATQLLENLTSLSAINVETRNHAESQNQRLVKTRGRWRHKRERPPKTLEIVRATHGSVELVPLRNVHVQEKLTCLHVITENLHPYNPIWGQCKALHHVVGY